MNISHQLVMQAISHARKMKKRLLFLSFNQKSAYAKLFESTMPTY
tara:strand:+ start:596 stop:730 length:135 start_codon:yes stop_codon:yes gene_type:complete